ncbi:hypothetical protein NL676_010807 [Syzygium grande]|nr:hypothetical protein NL676_010807 [Syzygium grande]
MDGQLIPRVEFLLELSGRDDDATGAVMRKLPAILKYLVEHLESHVEFGARAAVRCCCPPRTQLFLLPPLLFVGARPAATAARPSAARRPPWPLSIWPVAAVAAAAPARPPFPLPLFWLTPAPPRQPSPCAAVSAAAALTGSPPPSRPPPYSVAGPATAGADVATTVLSLLLRPSAPPLFLAAALAGSVLRRPAKQPLPLPFRRRRSCFSPIPCPPSQPPFALLSRRRRGCFGFFLRCPCPVFLFRIEVKRTPNPRLGIIGILGLV